MAVEEGSRDQVGWKRRIGSWDQVGKQRREERGWEGRDLVGSGFVVGVGHGLKRSASERVEKVVVGGDLDSTLTMFGQTSFSSDPRTPEGLSLAIEPGQFFLQVGFNDAAVKEGPPLNRSGEY